MPSFQYTVPLTATFPSIVGGVLIGTAANSPPSDRLTALYQSEQQAVKQRLGETPLSELVTVSAWRNAFRAFNVEPTKYRAASEALLRRLTKKGDIPSLNTLVDIGNLISIRYELPVAIFDVRDLAGESLSVRFSDGTEKFWPLGVDEFEQPLAGEVIFADAAHNVYARRWCWRQSRDSAAREDTTQVIVTVEAHHAGAMTTIEAALLDLHRLLKEHAAFQGGVGIASAAQSVFAYEP
jgi:DNA/RNA-binding domain of Phe-tRNA-synthetase-like protein